MRATMGQARKIAQREQDTVKAVLSRLYPEKEEQIPYATGYICDVLAGVSAYQLCADLELGKLIAGDLLVTFTPSAIVEWTMREVPSRRDDWTDMVMLRMLREQAPA